MAHESPSRIDFVGSRSVAFISSILYIYIYISLDFAEVYFHSRKKFYRCRRVFIPIARATTKIKAVDLYNGFDGFVKKRKKGKKKREKNRAKGSDIIARGINWQSDYPLTTF